MARVRLWVGLFAVTLMSWSTSACFAQKVDNPLYKLWSGYKVGSTKTMAGTMTAGDFTVGTEWTDKLVELTDDHATIEIVSVSTFNGQRHETPARRHEFTAKVDKKADWHEIGQEDVKAMGRTFHCKIVEAKFARPGSADQSRETDTKAWVDKAVPGGVVQMKISSGRGQEMTFAIKDFKAK